MPRYEHKVYRVKVDWEGADYYLSAIIEKSEKWTNVDVLGEQGWQFIAFVPNPEVYISGSFDAEHIQGVRLAVFRREMDEHEDMNWSQSLGDHLKSGHLWSGQNRPFNRRRDLVRAFK